MDVDQPGYDHQVADVTDLAGAISFELPADRCDPSVADRDIGWSVDAVARVDDVPAGEDEIIAIHLGYHGSGIPL
jgi:hypothetical protein